MNDHLIDDDEPPKVTRAKKIRLAVALSIGLSATASWVYVRYLVPKSPLGGTCRWAMNCKSDAPRCMRPSEDEDGVCSRPCEADAGDCAPSIHCISIELEERDDRGMPLMGGYCFPQSFLDAKKSKPKDAGAPLDSWLEVPSAPGQLEGEATVRWERSGAAAGEAKTVLVKGALLRTPAAGGKRTVVDTAGLRSIAVDDDKKTFAPTAIDVTAGDARVTKSGTKDHVDGRECELWQIDDGRVHREACVVMGAAYIDPSVRAVAPWTRELAIRGALPLRVIEQDAHGKETARMSLHFEAHAVDASFVAVPKSYKNLAVR